MDLSPTWRGLVSACLLPLAAHGAAGNAGEIAQALEKYQAAHSPPQQEAVVDFLRALDPEAVAGAILDHIAAARNGQEATQYNLLVEKFAPHTCDVLLARIQAEADPLAKGKLIVATRRCNGAAAIKVLAGALEDKRTFLFEAHGGAARRICDVAYDELFLKLRTDPKYGLDSSPKMHGLILPRTPESERDALIAALKSKLPAQ